MKLRLKVESLLMYIMNSKNKKLYFLLLTKNISSAFFKQDEFYFKASHTLNMYHAHTGPYPPKAFSTLSFCVAELLWHCWTVVAFYWMLLYGWSAVGLPSNSFDMIVSTFAEYWYASPANEGLQFSLYFVKMLIVYDQH